MEQTKLKKRICKLLKGKTCDDYASCKHFWKCINLELKEKRNDSKEAKREDTSVDEK